MIGSAVVASAVWAFGLGSMLPAASAAGSSGAPPEDLRAAIGHCTQLTDAGGRLILL